MPTGKLGTDANRAYMKAYMARRRQRYKSMESALQTILVKLEGRSGALGNELRQLAEEGLNSE